MSWERDAVYFLRDQLAACSCNAMRKVFWSVGVASLNFPSVEHLPLSRILRPSPTKRHFLFFGNRSDGMGGRVHAGLQELEGMELDEDLALPVAPGIDVLTHRISLARLQHVSNLAWCLGSWLPHLVSLAVLLIRMVRNYSDLTPVFSRRRHSVASELFISFCRFQSPLMYSVDFTGTQPKRTSHGGERRAVFSAGAYPQAVRTRGVRGCFRLR